MKFNFKVGELYLYHRAMPYNKETVLWRLLKSYSERDNNKKLEQVYIFEVFNTVVPNTIVLSATLVAILTNIGGKFERLKGRARKLAAAKFLLKR